MYTLDYAKKNGSINTHKRFKNGEKLLSFIQDKVNDNEDSMKNVVYMYSCSAVLNSWNSSFSTFTTDDDIYMVGHITQIVKELSEIDNKEKIGFLLTEHDSFESAYTLSLEMLNQQGHPLTFEIN